MQGCGMPAFISEQQMPVIQGKSNTTKNNNKGKNDVRVGDWICQRCNNHNFSFRTKCNMCHLSHEASVKMAYTFNNGNSQQLKDASVPSSAGYNSAPKLPSNSTSANVVPHPFMNQLQSTMRERVVHVHQYFNTYQVQPQAYVQSSLAQGSQNATDPTNHATTAPTPTATNTQGGQTGQQ